MKCEIIWNCLKLEEWEGRFSHIKHSNILQSYAYARAICATQKQRARWGLIKIEGKEAGLVQILEAGLLWNALHAVILDRGPLWFDGFGGAAHISAFFKEFNRLFPRRMGRKRRIIPEVEDGPAASQILKQAGLERNNAEAGYQTLWWNLTTDADAARNCLHPKWRASLQKAEGAGLVITWDKKGQFFPWIKGLYAGDKAMRGYGGPSPQLLDNLAAFSTSDNPMIIGKATHEGDDIAGILIFKHGTCATYQVGWTSATGRQYNAHHLLLWQSYDILKQHGVRHFDLGGINDDTAAGVKKFKSGTGAHPVRLVGHYY